MLYLYQNVKEYTLQCIQSFSLSIPKLSMRSLVNEIRKRKATFFGNVMRKEEMEHLVTAGKIDGKQSRGRQREKMLDSMTSWLQKENPI